MAAVRFFLPRVLAAVADSSRFSDLLPLLGAHVEGSQTTDLSELPTFPIVASLPAGGLFEGAPDAAGVRLEVTLPSPLSSGTFSMQAGFMVGDSSCLAWQPRYSIGGFARGGILGSYLLANSPDSDSKLTGVLMFLSGASTSVYQPRIAFGALSGVGMFGPYDIFNDPMKYSQMNLASGFLTSLPGFLYEGLSSTRRLQFSVQGMSPFSLLSKALADSSLKELPGGCSGGGSAGGAGTVGHYPCLNLDGLVVNSPGYNGVFSGRIGGIVCGRSSCVSGRVEGTCKYDDRQVLRLLMELRKALIPAVSEPSPGRKRIDQVKKVLKMLAKIGALGRNCYPIVASGMAYYFIGCPSPLEFVSWMRQRRIANYKLLRQDIEFFERLEKEHPSEDKSSASKDKSPRSDKAPPSSDKSLASKDEAPPSSDKALASKDEAPPSSDKPLASKDKAPPSDKATTSDKAPLSDKAPRSDKATTSDNKTAEAKKPWW